MMLPDLAPSLPGTTPRRVSIVSSIVYLGDAVSATIVADMDALGRLSRRERRTMDIKVFCRSSDYADGRTVVVEDWRDVVRNPHFQTSDVIIFHFGVFNEIYSTLEFAPRDAATIVYFHNVTPPQYLPKEAEPLIHQSYQQIASFRNADIIVAASDYSKRQLDSYGLGRPVEVVPLFGPNGARGPINPRPFWSAGAPLRLLFCGRFIASKGASDLL